MESLLKQVEGSHVSLRVGAILLAAGEGSRLGKVPKCLLSLQGMPLIKRHMIALSGAGVDEVVVVTGYYHADVEPAVESFPVKVVRNPAPEEGQQSSVRLGLEAVTNTLDLVLIMLADQPLLTANDLTELISTFKKRSPGTSIVYPEVNEQRGNPVIFSGELIAQLLAADKKIGCRKFIDDNPALVHKLITENDHFVLDIDTPEDVMTFEKRTGWKLTLPVLT
jgi:CTP:molybdopterin cytidylyltransferase MocA